MKKYEFKGEYCDTEGKDELIKIFNEYGKDGWSVVSIIPLVASNPASILTDYWYIIYQKEVNDNRGIKYDE